MFLDGNREIPQKSPPITLRQSADLPAQAELRLHSTQKHPLAGWLIYGLYILQYQNSFSYWNPVSIYIADAL